MDVIPKYRIPVRVALTQEGAVLGVIFVRQEQRIIDMLCDQRPFFPIKTKDGTFLINKSSVIKLEPLDDAFVKSHAESFPGHELEQGHEPPAAIAERRSRRMAG